MKNVEIVDLWARGQQYNTHDVNYFKMPDGSMTVSLPERRRLTIPCPDSLGMTMLSGERITMQEALDKVYLTLDTHCGDSRPIWDLNIAKRWGRAPATEGQLKVIRLRCKGFNADGLTKFQASQILNRLFGGTHQ